MTSTHPHAPTTEEPATISDVDALEEPPLSELVVLDVDAEPSLLPVPPDPDRLSVR